MEAVIRVLVLWVLCGVWLAGFMNGSLRHNFPEQYGFADLGVSLGLSIAVPPAAFFVLVVDRWIDDPHYDFAHWSLSPWPEEGHG